MLKKIFHKEISSQGFSMAESLVTIFIFSILTAGLYTAMAVGQESWQTNKVRMELQQELRKAMDWMQYDLHQAGANSIANVPADGNWYTTITFKTPSGVVSGSINWNANATQFVLGGADSNELHRVLAGNTKILAQNVESLEFRRQVATPNILEVAMLGEKDTLKGDTINYQLDFKVQLRN